jgi:hypothetical protein
MFPDFTRKMQDIFVPFFFFLYWSEMPISPSPLKLLEEH